MFRSLVIFAVIFGISSAISLKDDLNAKLDDCEAKLNAAIARSSQNGFHYITSEFYQLVARVHTKRDAVAQLVDGSTSASNGDLFQAVNDLRTEVTNSVSNPVPREHLKARVLYLAAIKQVFNLSTITFPPEQHIADVNKIIVLEIQLFNNVFFAANQWQREKDSAELAKLYKDLEASIEFYVVPTFDGHYQLANRTRVKINEYIRKDDYLTAKELRAELTQFDSLTLSLAGLFPINGDQKVYQYVNISRGHFQQKQKLEQVKRLEPVLKETLLKRVEEMEHLVNSAYNKALNQRVIFYTKVLTPTKDRVQGVRRMVEGMTEDHNESNSGLVLQVLRQTEAFVATHTKNPSPAEDMKSRGLYLAAMRTQADPRGAEILKSAVKQIVDFETQAKAVFGLSSADKEALEYARAMLDSKYLTLENLLKGPAIVPGPDEHQKQGEISERLIKDLNAGKYGKWGKYADRYFQVSYQFKAKTSIINQIIPIDSNEKIEAYYKGALEHYTMNNEMWSLVEKFRSTDVTQVKGGFGDCTNHRCRFEEMQKIMKKLEDAQKKH